jgi:transcriptional regulator with XRE-family HTH domain
MNLADNIKSIREVKELKQIEDATHIGVDKSGYSKIEKGQRTLSVEDIQKVTQLFNLTTDQVLHYDGNIPTKAVNAPLSAAR